MVIDFPRYKEKAPTHASGLGENQLIAGNDVRLQQNNPQP